MNRVHARFLKKLGKSTLELLIGTVACIIILGIGALLVKGVSFAWVALMPASFDPRMIFVGVMLLIPLAFLFFGIRDMWRDSRKEINDEDRKVMNTLRSGSEYGE